MTKLGQYRKTGAALIGSALTWTGVAYVPDGHVTRPEWFALALVLATTAGVYSVENAPTPTVGALPAGMPTDVAPVPVEDFPATAYTP